MTLHQRPSPNHILHAICTVVLPLWCIVWILSCPRGPWRCQACGSGTGKDRSISSVIIAIAAALVLVIAATSYWILTRYGTL